MCLTKIYCIVTISWHRIYESRFLKGEFRKIVLLLPSLKFLGQSVLECFISEVSARRPTRIEGLGDILRYLPSDEAALFSLALRMDFEVISKFINDGIRLG